MGKEEVRLALANGHALPSRGPFTPDAISAVTGDLGHDPGPEEDEEDENVRDGPDTDNYGRSRYPG
jgi:hypothetical protein